MKPTAEEIGNLLALKRHERPEEGYMEDFLREFHHRRREEAMEKKGVSTYWKQFTEWLSEPGLAKWAYGAGVAYAAALAFVLAVPQAPQAEHAPHTPVGNQIMEPRVIQQPSQLGELDLRASSEGEMGEQEF